MFRSRLSQLLILTLMYAAFCSASVAQDCKISGTPTWNESLRDVVADCAVEFPSPNNLLLLKFASDGRMSIKGKIIHLRGRRVEPPAMVSWSPESDMFFINDGEGSGMSSTFRLLRVKRARIYEDKAVMKAAVSLYRRRTRCSPRSIDPDVWGYGWGDGGSKLYLLVQATVHEPCGSPDKFISLVVRTSDGKILETLSNTQTKVRFGSHLPSSLFGK
ncbi:MAG: hypothetical protein QOE33_297 [Acidobacteriota bacterium]|nr:hypothetical protein [Acidobacteriota bacterium]